MSRSARSSEERLRGRTLCIGSTYTRNYGDRAIFRVLRDTLKARGQIHARPFPLKPIVANRRGSSMGLLGKAIQGLFVLPHHYRLMSKRVRSVSTVIVGGGNLIHDVHPLTVVQFLLAAITVRCSGRHFLVFGVGAGPLRSGFSRLCIGLACSLSDGVIIRDTYSQATLRQCFGHARWLRPAIVPDVVLSLERGGDARGADELGIDARERSNRKRRIGISVMCYMKPGLFPGGTDAAYEAYLERMERLVRLLVEEFECEVLLFSNEPSEDQTAVDELYRRVSDVPGVSSKRVDCLSMAIDLPGTCDYHIGARLHSLIFSLAQSVPSVALTSHGRVSGLFTDLDAQDLLHDISDFEPAAVVASVRELEGGRAASLLAKVAQKRSEARSGLSEMVTEIAAMEDALFERAQ